MENIAKKISILNYSEEMMSTLPKFLATLVAYNPKTGEEIVTEEELKQIVSYLKEKNITLRPGHLKVLALGFPYIKKAIEDIEKIDELKMYIDDPTRMIVKDNVNRILYLRKNNITYKSEDGKYAKFAYNKKAFESEFGRVDFTKESKEDFKPLKEEKPKENVKPVLLEEKVQKIVLNSKPKEEEIIKETEKEDKEYTGILDLENIKASFNTKTKDSNEKKKELNEKIVPFKSGYDAILDKTQTVALTSDTLERFEKLSDSLRHILISVYNITEVNDKITENLIKLITANVSSDSDVLYSAITYGKSISDEESKQLKDAIEEELEYIKIFDLDTDEHGRSA